MAIQNALVSSAAKIKRGDITRSRKHNYVVRLLGSQSTIFRAGGELKNQPSSDPDAAKLAQSKLPPTEAPDPASLKHNLMGIGGSQTHIRNCAICGPLCRGIDVVRNKLRRTFLQVALLATAIISMACWIWLLGVGIRWLIVKL